MLLVTPNISEVKKDGLVGCGGYGYGGGTVMAVVTAVKHFCVDCCVVYFIDYCRWKLLLNLESMKSRSV